MAADDIINSLKNKIALEEMEVFRQKIAKCVKDLYEKGFDREEIKALIVGGLEKSDNYSPSLNIFVCLRVDREFRKLMISLKKAIKSRNIDEMEK